MPVGNSDRIALVGAEKVEVAHAHRLAQVVLQKHAVGGELDLVVIEKGSAMLALHRRQLGLSLQEVDLSVQVELLRPQIHLPVPLTPAALVGMVRAALSKDEVQSLGVVEHQIVKATGAVEVLVEVGGVDEGKVVFSRHRTPVRHQLMVLPYCSRE